MKKKNKNGRFISKVMADTGFCASAYFGGFRAEIVSDYEAVVYGVKTISEYTTAKVSLKYNKGCLSFIGEELCCESYVEGVVCIRGKICSMQFDEC